MKQPSRDLVEYVYMEGIPNEQEFLNSIDEHLLKSNDFTVIDLTGFTEEQIGTVRAYINNLPAESQSKIISVGF